MKVGLRNDGGSQRSPAAKSAGAGEIREEASRGTDTSTMRARFLPPAIAAGATFVLLAAAKATTPQFLTATNFVGVVRAASLVGIAALGMTFLTLARYYFSLSVEQTATMAAIAFAAFLNAGLGMVAAVVGALIVAAGIGLIQGAIVVRGGNPIITTLAAGAGLSGLAAVVTHDQTIYIKSQSIGFLATGRPLGLPVQTWAFLLLVAVATVILNWTRIGRTIMLVGANPHTARGSGLSVGTATLFAFAASAIGGGIVGIFYAATASQAVVNQVSGLNFQAVAAVLVGGTAIQGGEGSMLRTAIGAVFITLLVNFAVIRGYGTGPQTFFQGVAMVLAVSTYSLLRRKSSR
jgi:simple sugar transport system permease protein/ribose transport system permease protein